MARSLRAGGSRRKSWDDARCCSGGERLAIGTMYPGGIPGPGLAIMIDLMRRVAICATAQSCAPRQKGTVRLNGHNGYQPPAGGGKKKGRRCENAWTASAASPGSSAFSCSSVGDRGLFLASSFHADGRRRRGHASAEVCRKSGTSRCSQSPGSTSCCLLCHHLHTMSLGHTVGRGTRGGRTGSGLARE